jgi:hypothetical protein
MMNLLQADPHIHLVSNFQDLISTPFQGEINAMCWNRDLAGDFSEIIQKIDLNENIAEIDEEQLRELDLNEQGQLARIILLSDLNLLKVHGASPTLNLIRCYDKDSSFFPTDVYSFHVDRSPVPTNTFLCTYYGAPSEIIANSQAQQKVMIPEIRDELKKFYQGTDEGFESFLSEHFFDLHYSAKPAAPVISLGLGHLWKLAVDHPESNVIPCIHRAPNEKPGETRLLLIC